MFADERFSNPTAHYFRFVATVSFMPWYRSWFDSPYYDVLYSNRNGAEAEAFVKRLLDFLQPHPDSIMADIPCGTGRHAQFLAAAGHEVYGYDLSEDNIREAKQLEHDKLHFAVLDMRQMFHIRFFDFVFNLFTSLGYFDTDRYDLRIIKNFSSALKANGTLVIDFFNAYYAIEHLKDNDSVRRNGFNFDISKRYDGTHIVKDIRVDKEPDQLFTERVRAYTVNDFERMLQYAGFKVRIMFGDYDLHPFDQSTSPRLIIVADKA